MAGISTLPPGTILGDRQYKILAVRGQGSFGITYTGWDFSLERTVAIKECFPAEICTRDAETGQIHARSPELEDAYLMAMADLHKEARTLAQLNHRNIVQVHAVFAANGSLFCVMHYAEGDTLRDKLDAAEDADTPLPAAETTVWLTKLLGALQYMHRGGVIHRDIKPANIVFDEEGEPLLVDFGAAVNLTTLTHTLTQGEFSAAYAAPEQLANKGNIGPWTDLFALAATWYEVLTNCQAEETIRRMMEDTLDSLDQFPIGSQEPLLAAAVMRCLALKPQERCQSAQEWLDMLAGAQPPAGEPARGRIDTTARRRKAYLFGGAAAAALLLAAGTTALLMSRGTDTPPATTPTGTGPTTPTTPTEEPQSPARPAADKEELFRQALEHYKIDELISKHEELAKKARQLKRDRATDRMMIRDRALLDATEDQDFGIDRPDYLNQAREKLEELNNKYTPQLQALEDENYRLFRKICEAENDLSDGKGWTSVLPQEEPLLPLVRSMLGNHIREQISTFTFNSLQKGPMDTYDDEEKRLSTQFLDKMLDLSRRGQEQQQIAEDAADKREKQTGEEKVGRMLREHYGVDTLLQLDREIRQMQDDLLKQELSELEQLSAQGQEAAKGLLPKEFRNVRDDFKKKINDVQSSYSEKRSDLRKRHFQEVEQKISGMHVDLDNPARMDWLSAEEREAVPEVRTELKAETTPCLKLPKGDNHADNAVEESFRKAMDQLGKEAEKRQKQRDAEDEAAGEARLDDGFNRLVDKEKVGAWMARYKELHEERQRVKEQAKAAQQEYARSCIPEMVEAIKAGKSTEYMQQAKQDCGQVYRPHLERARELVQQVQKEVTTPLQAYAKELVKKAEEEKLTERTPMLFNPIYQRFKKACTLEKGGCALNVPQDPVYGLHNSAGKALGEAYEEAKKQAAGN